LAIELVVIKAIGNSCNLRCPYCYTSPTMADYSIMTDSIIENTIQAIAPLDPLPIHLWSGGEPLLAGKKFFQKVLTLQSKYYQNRNVINSVQTNGTLLNRQWINFFKKYNFQIGISWDGPNNPSRITIKGEPTSERVWKNIQQCLEEDLMVGIITVITKKNIKQVPKITKLLYSVGIKHWLCKPYIGIVKDLSIDVLDYAKIMCKLLDLWLKQDDAGWIIEPCYSFIRALCGNMSGISCQLTKGCHEFLTIEQNGDITCCDFIPQRAIFGNIQKMNLHSLANNPTYKQFVLSAGNAPCAPGMRAVFLAIYLRRRMPSL